MASHPSINIKILTYAQHNLNEWSWHRTYHLECVWCIWRCSARRQSPHIRNADMLFAPISLLLFFMCVWDRRQDLGRMYVRICEHVHAWAQINWRMLPSCHAMAVFWRICRPACWAQTPHLSYQTVCFPVGRLVWRQKVPEDEAVAQSTVGRHLFTAGRVQRRFLRNY